LKILNYADEAHPVTAIQRKPVIFKNGKAILKSSRHWLRGLFGRYIKDQGVHSYIPSVSDKLCLYSRERILKAEIPPFTPYWIGKLNDIASARLIIYED
jgi:hypothetical protein